MLAVKADFRAIQERKERATPAVSEMFSEWRVAQDVYQDAIRLRR